MKNDKAVQQAYEGIVALSIKNHRISRSEAVAVLSIALDAATKNLSVAFYRHMPKNSDTEFEKEAPIEILLRGGTIEEYHAALAAERTQGAQ